VPGEESGRGRSGEALGPLWFSVRAAGGAPERLHLLGDIPQMEGPAKLPNVQGVLKYTYSMKALKEMGYLGVGVGQHEAALSLGRIEGEWAINNDTPAVLVANLENQADFPGFKPLAIETVPGTNFRVGVTNIIGPTVAESIKDPAVNFKKKRGNVLSQQLAAMQAQNVSLPLLLYHGLVTPRQGDGLVEAHNPQREMFDLPRLRQLVGEQPGGAPLIAALLAALATFTGPTWEQEDDVTLVTLQRLDAAAGAENVASAQDASHAAHKMVE